MADVTLKLFADVPHYDLRAEIEGLIYTLRLRFDADGYWYLSILDEAASVAFRYSRRILPIGPWLAVDDDDKMSVQQLRDTYDLASAFFPGMLLAVSPRPLALEQADGSMLQLNYYTADSLAAGDLS